MGTLGWILFAVLVVVALIAPVIASEHARSRAVEKGWADPEPDQGAATDPDPDTPVTPLPAPLMGPPDQAQ